MKKLVITMLILISISASMFSISCSKGTEKVKENTIAITDSTYLKEFNKATDIDSRREIQSKWAESNSTEALAYYANLFKTTETAENAYFLGRITEDPKTQLDLARKAISLDSNFTYGYKLLASVYSMTLFRGDDSYLVDFEKDYTLIEKFYEISKETGDADEIYFNALLQKGIFDKAEELLNKGITENKRWAGIFSQAKLQARMGNTEKVESIISDFVEQSIQGGRYEEADRKPLMVYYTSSIYVDSKMYDAAVNFLIKNDSETDKEIPVEIARMYSFKKDNENIFKYLFLAADRGFDSVKSLEDKDFDSIKSDEKWSKFSEQVKLNREKGAADRRKEVLASKFSKPAPIWSLEDVNGNTISLADLKGKVLVLDFWATWCNPCRMAMPVIDKWIKTSKPENVRVFSINVWEEGAKTKAPKFMTDNNYAMELLYGNNELTQQYGISGIPYICVIDQDGNIVYEEKGFSENLEENLVWWIDSLIK
ncbi:MAG: TlpA family protein disulfide reductase [Candidatus Delongbacteria bacterium]|nr:TlpA family protein disulfide reductase [Candidatus Delongbacteria bacterium]MBN2836205.1 TlpA family protein disulfide reductase [Candidatus Delongbacteria bacterium]